MTTFEFCRDFRRRKTRVSALSRGVVCVNPTFSRFSRTPTCDRRTDGQTDRQTDTRRQLIPALASDAGVKLYGWIFVKIRQYVEYEPDKSWLNFGGLGLGLGSVVGVRVAQLLVV